MNKIIIAAAGSGKTTHIVDQAIRNEDKRILITTFTDANTEEIKKSFIKNAVVFRRMYPLSLGFHSY